MPWPTVSSSTEAAGAPAPQGGPPAAFPCAATLAREVKRVSGAMSAPSGPASGRFAALRWALGASPDARFVPRSLAPGFRRRAPAPRFGGPSPPARPAGRPSLPGPASPARRAGLRRGLSAWALALALGGRRPPCGGGRPCLPSGPRCGLCAAAGPPSGPPSPAGSGSLARCAPGRQAAGGGLFTATPPRGGGFGAVLPRGYSLAQNSSRVEPCRFAALDGFCAREGVEIKAAGRWALPAGRPIKKEDLP